MTSAVWFSLFLLIVVVVIIIQVGLREAGPGGAGAFLWGL